MKPCGAALMDTVLAGIRKMQAAAMDFEIDAISAKDFVDTFHYPAPIFNDPPR